MTVTPVPVWPWPMTTGRLDLLRSAKMMLQTEDKIIPVGAEPGTPGRVLAFGVLPDFFCTSVFIKPENVDNVESVSKALSFLLGAPDGASGLFSESDWLSAVMGVPVRLVGVEEHAPVRFDTSAR